MTATFQPGRNSEVEKAQCLDADPWNSLQGDEDQ